METIDERIATLGSGMRWPYAETGTAGGSASLVFVHAFVESWRYFEPVLRSLPPWVHAVAPTQRGHQSAGGSGAGFEISDFVSDVVDFIGAVGTVPAVLVGASSGGLVAQAVAAAHPQLVAGLVLISSPVTLADKVGVAAMREEILALSDPMDPRFVEQFVRSTSPDEVPEDRISCLVQESLALPADVWKAWFLGLLRAEQPQALEAVRVPTCLLCGSTDRYVRGDQQVLLDRIPDAELVLYDLVGHAPHLSHPDRVAADISDFLQKHRAELPSDAP